MKNSMSRKASRLWFGLLARYVVLLVVLGVIATATYSAVDADDRPLVLRLAVAAFVAVVLLHIHGHFRQRLEWAGSSAFDQARQGKPAEPKVATMVMRLKEQLQHATLSQRYFKESLLPRLTRLSEARGTQQPLPDLPGRRWRRRGPTLAAIGELVRRIGDEQ